MAVPHYGDSVWVDFARGLTPAAERQAVADHRAACPRCRRKAGLFEALLAACRADAEYEVPAGAVRLARSVFALRQPETVRFLPRLAARLVFDSFLEPQPAGVRGGQRISRQVMYRGGHHYLDLRLLSDPEPGRVHLVGQIADDRRPDVAPANVPVLLFSSDGSVVAHTTSDRFGEFHLRYTPGPRLKLFVPVSAKASFRVPVDGVSRVEKGPRRRSRRRPSVRSGKA